MRSNTCVRRFAGVGAGVAFLAISTSALSAPITGQFSLQQDFDVTVTASSGSNDPEVFEAGDLAANVSFIFDDASLTMMGSGVAEIDVSSISIFDRTNELDLNNDTMVTAGVGLLEGTNFLGFGPSVTLAPVSGELVARFDRDNGNAFLGLSGASVLGAPPAIGSVVFGFNSITLLLADATGSIQSYNGSFTNFSSNSFTQVPEPTALALLGAGLVGFGFARKKSQR